MPLHPNAENRIRRNLQALRSGKNPQRAIIGHLADLQLVVINSDRVANGLPAIASQIIFIGRHLYQSRCVKDDYSIEEVIAQIKSALDPACVFKPTRSWTVLRNPVPRPDGRGHMVNDEAVFECTTRAPNPELFSVIPKGDGKNF